MHSRTQRRDFPLAWRSIAVMLLMTTVAITNAYAQRRTKPPCTKAGSCRGRLTLSTGRKVQYYRTAPLNQRNSRAKVAVIIIHGINRNADDYFERTINAVKLSRRMSTTMVIAPRFQRKEDNPKSDEHFWTGGWSRGDLSQDSKRISSFSVVDHIFAQLCRRDRFPNLSRVVLAGHSAGGQFVNRYAAAGKAEAAPGVRVRFLVMNPSTFLYISPVRLNSKGKLYIPKVAGYNDWKYGLRDLNTYASKTGVSRCRKNMTSRRVFYLGGDQDTGTSNLDTTGPAKVQGKNRYDRFLKYRAYVQNYVPPFQFGGKKLIKSNWWKNATFGQVKGVGHSSSKMLASKLARQVIFKK